MNIDLGREIYILGGNMELYKKLKRKVSVVVAILIGVVVLLGGFAYFSKGAFMETKNKMPIYSVNTKEKKVAITFDTSWGADNTESILNTLDKYNIKATFFLVGAWCDDYPDKVKAIVKRGHEIGNHSNKHPNFTTITKDRIIKEVEITNAKILGLTGQTPSLFRFPEGQYNDLAVQTIDDGRMISIQWDVDSVDWKGNGAEEEYNRVVKNINPGSIVLFHIDGKYTPESLPKIIETLQKEGYEFVKVTDLLMKENYSVDSKGRQVEK